MMVVMTALRDELHRLVERSQVEDAVNGVKSGKAAGCFVIGLTTSFPAQALKLVGADLIVPSFEALEAYLFEGSG